MTPESCWRLCRECAAQIYVSTSPNQRYQDSTARLLAGTAATESNLTARRQYGYKLDRMDGAWGLWQTEADSVTRGVAQLKASPALLQRATDFVYRGDGVIEAMLTAGTQCWLKEIHDNDRMAVLFARLHYFRISKQIPFSLPEQAAYYKLYYNSVYGKGSAAKFMADYNRILGDS